MNEQELFKEIEFILDSKRFPYTDKISRKTTLTDSAVRGGLGFDSLDIVEFIFDLEIATHKECETEDSEKFKTIGDVIDFFKTE